MIGVRAAGRWFRDSVGTYEATGEKHEGAPVYKNSNGKYVYRHSDGIWHNNSVVGGHSPTDGGWRSVDTSAKCPATVSQWEYHNYYAGHYISGDITVKCGQHPVPDPFEGFLSKH